MVRDIHDPTRQANLIKMGFQGFITFSDLAQYGHLVPRNQGVYAVVRTDSDPPQFLHTSPAGHHKHRDPSVQPSVLEANWVPGTEVIYLGKASAGETGLRGIAKRLDEYRRHGAGETAGHWGGRYVWQLTDSHTLQVGWLDTGSVDPSVVEARLLADFIDRTGRLPFANLRRETVPLTPSFHPDNDNALSVVIAGTAVAQVRFKLHHDTGRLELVDISTFLKLFERRGHGKAAIRWLLDHYTDFDIVKSPPGTNSPDGTAFVAALRELGWPIHEWACYNEGKGCTCALATAP